MSTAKEIIYTIKNLRSGGIQDDDNKLSDLNYLDIINYYRSKLIRQEIDRKKKLDPLLIQPLGDVEIERVAFNRGQPLSGKTVFRTKDKLPRAIATDGTNLVTFVGDNLLGEGYHRCTVDNVGLMVRRKITGLKAKWFEFDERIYVVTEDPLTNIVIHLVAENPYKVIEFKKEVNIFDPLDFEYPMSDTMRDSLYKLMSDLELKISNVLTDNTNDGLDKPDKV